jgi:phage tail sheath protein FI
VPIQGVTGIDPLIDWDLMDPNTQAGLLNAADVTTLIRTDGYRFWGNRTCSADPNEAFESAVRSGDALGDTIANSKLWAMDRPMTRVLLSDLVEEINSKLREWKAMGWIVDGRAWIPQDGRNSEETLKGGQFFIDYDYMWTPPLEHLILQQRVNGSYLIQLIQ